MYKFINTIFGDNILNKIHCVILILIEEKSSDKSIKLYILEFTFEKDDSKACCRIVNVLLLFLMTFSYEENWTTAFSAKYYCLRKS